MRWVQQKFIESAKVNNNARFGVRLEHCKTSSGRLTVGSEHEAIPVQSLQGDTSIRTRGKMVRWVTRKLRRQAKLILEVERHEGVSASAHPVSETLKGCSLSKSDAK